MIAVMGATGNTGRIISERLLEAGLEVRALGRSTERLAGLVDQGAEAVVGEAADASYLTAAFTGADAVYTLIPPSVVAEDYAGLQDHVGEAIVTAIVEHARPGVAVRRIAGEDSYIPLGPAAQLVLPSEDDIVEGVRSMR